MTSNEVVRKLKRDGWYKETQKGSHAQFVHPKKTGKVTIPMHQGKEIPPGTLNSIFKQAGWK